MCSHTATNRRWDLVTVVTPSLSIFGDEPNAQLSFSYSPQFRLDCHDAAREQHHSAVVGDGSVYHHPRRSVPRCAGVRRRRTFADGPRRTGRHVLNPDVRPRRTRGPTGLSQQQLGRRPAAFRSRPMCCIASVTPARPNSAMSSISRPYHRAAVGYRCSFQPAATPSTHSPTKPWRNSRPVSGLPHSGTCCCSMHARSTGTGVNNNRQPGHNHQPARLCARSRLGSVWPGRLREADGSAVYRRHVSTT